jgi:hypothetical protein
VKLISVLTCGAVLAGCSNAASQSPFMPPITAETGAPATHETQAKAQTTGSAAYVYVSNRAKSGASELVVYPWGGSSRTPSLKVTSGLVDVGGVAVDASGNVYVANGSAGNVLEFAPGGTALVRTYSKGLTNPADVAVANGTLYVADRGNASNGYSQQIFEYSTSQGGKPTSAIAGIGAAPQLNAAVAVNPMASESTFFASATSAGAMPPSGGCGSSGSGSSNGYTVAENLFPTLWENIPLSHNSQVSGVAFDSHGNLYASDTCANVVAVYAYKKYTWTYTGTVGGSFSAPFFLTVNDGFLAVPSASAGSESGRVTVIDLSGSSQPVTLRSGLEHPIGASVGSAS